MVEPPLMDFRLTAIMFAVLAGLGAVVWFSEFRDKGSAAATPADKPKPEIFKFDDKEAKQVEVARADQKVLVEKDEQGNWVLQPSGLPGDRVRITSVLSRLASLQATRQVTDAPTDLAQYGLDNPNLTATVTQTDGSSYILQTGARAPSDAGTYVKKADEPAVFLIANQIVTDLERLVTEPPIQQPTPTPAAIPSPSPASTPEPTPTPTG
jgi:hypothetical protein